MQAELEEERGLYIERLQEALSEVARMREVMEIGGPGAEERLATSAFRERLDTMMRDIREVGVQHFAVFRQDGKDAMRSGYLL